ncbi:MAG: hypothetical protein ACRCT8_11040, partial [Lacipirellulaceae bacterium]
MAAQALALLAALSAPAALAESVDASRRVLEGLREHGHTGLALEFLESASNDPLASDEFRAQVPFERVVTLLDVARAARDVQRRSALVREAAAALDALGDRAPSAAPGALADAAGKVAIA